MLNLTNASSVPHKLKLTTSVGATIDVHASWADNNAGVMTFGSTNTAISTATTTDIVAAPAGTVIRNVKTLHIRNRDATNSCDVTVIIDVNTGGSTFELHKATLIPGAQLEYIEGVGFFTITAPVTTLGNESTTSQGGGTVFASDVYLANSNITIPTGSPVVGTVYRCIFDVTKTGAGTAAPVVILRMGTLGTTGDTARLTFTFGVGTAVIDTAVVEARVIFRSVGSGTSAVVVGHARANCLPATGWSSTIKAVSVVSAGFDSTVASTIMGISYNGGASAVHTVQMVTAELVK